MYVIFKSKIAQKGCTYIIHTSNKSMDITGKKSFFYVVTDLILNLNHLSTIHRFNSIFIYLLIIKKKNNLIKKFTTSDMKN